MKKVIAIICLLFIFVSSYAEVGFKPPGAGESIKIEACIENDFESVILTPLIFERVAVASGGYVYFIIPTYKEVNVVGIKYNLYWKFKQIYHSLETDLILKKLLMNQGKGTNSKLVGTRYYNKNCLIRTVNV